jgi:hypothetical protein
VTAMILTVQASYSKAAVTLYLERVNTHHLYTGLNDQPVPFDGGRSSTLLYASRRTSNLRQGSGEGPRDGPWSYRVNHKTSVSQTEGRRYFQYREGKPVDVVQTSSGP